MDLFDVNPAIQQYLENHTSPEDEVLAELRRYTHLKVVHPRMLSGPVQGKFLELISKIMMPGRILEIGTYTGYSAICLAKGLAEEGKLITIEINDELKSIQERFFKMAGLEDKIHCITGNALKIIPELEDEFDLVFIDGDKEQYCDYYNLCLHCLKKGGILIADNVLWDGKVIKDQFKMDKSTKEIDKFNQLTTSDKSTENVMIPIRDGLSLIRKL